MKKYLLGFLLISFLSVEAQIKQPALSPTQTVIQEFGLSKLELVYSRPSIKGRTLFKEGSELGPLGSVWRTGANNATKLKVNDPITIAGKNVDTGSYAIYTIPGKKMWTIIINSDSKKWGTQYNEKDDLFRVDVPAETLKSSVETFTMQFANISAENCDLQLMWGNTLINIPITTNVRDRIRVQVEKALSADNVTSSVYQQAANFYYEYDKDYDKALTNITKAVGEKTDKFWYYLLKAKIEKALGDKVAAKQSAETCRTLATEQKNDDYVRFATMLIKSL
ncbi:MAG: DUF2911 domain-containing protein [Chitinophagaceae bacterium]|nr:DUF2911 domain-containing protein [Chitinophagaceae bacterium]